MILGTASNAGKSLLAAGICKALTRRGFNIAPFKAQNMSLNSWITTAGEEIGIAQAIQARACGLEPQAAMNPVLLKPMGAQGSQILAMGKPYGTMPYSGYVKRKRDLWQIVVAAYSSLASGRDAMILEGAGSPAEINLRKHDIVNLRMARHARARAILVADIDKGGAFAAIAGTMALLSRRDRQLIAAFALNKFRGDPSLLTPALKQLKKQCGRPFLGVLPMLENLRLPEEDSANFTSRPVSQAPAPPDKLDIAIITLPYMSNFADWDPLLAEPYVHTRFVEHPEQLGKPHILLIPGSRHVPDALAKLRATGLDCAIKTLAKQMHIDGRGQIVGVCAGLEILGSAVADPEGLEGGGIHPGLDLLPLSISLETAKTLERRTATVLPPIMPTKYRCEGQEIHHGCCKTQLAPAILAENGKAVGWSNLTGQIWGTWLHGIFDNDQFRHDWLNGIAAQYNLGTVATMWYNWDNSLDMLADAVEENLNMDLLLTWLLAQKHKKASAKTFQDPGRTYCSGQHP